MDNQTVYKIKDSVDLFLSDEKYLMAYYMNTRQRKSFKINKEMILLIEQIDGKHTVQELKDYMTVHHQSDNESVAFVLALMESNRLITDTKVKDNILSVEEHERYSRQINYFSEFLGSEEEGIYGQKKLMNAHVLIFGCGAIGGNIAMELVMAGVKNITLYDYDTVACSDVSRHMYFREEHIGEGKVAALKEELYKIDHSVEVYAIEESMNPYSDIEGYIKEADFVINTLDEPYIGYTSSKISRCCIQYNIPHYIAGGFDAHLASTGELIIPHVTPCVECYAGHFKETLKGWKPKEHPVRERYTEIGGLASMSLFSASFAAIEIIKYIAGLVNISEEYKVRGELLFTDLSLTYLNVMKNNNCPVCGGDGI
ncbi:molybdopterin/thiamine biosynthesis adenylyltransferase [Trichococcus patagoniensis]|uniref:Molybdopterin/thiamine biosynthesis adenylyltransferase n=1 Tax=Trichococcus patagoniensis TaxID=382641 RepID=A0A2T5IQ56_9LACT|nr:ThiF family adenylyltransferase [Trichococcus patagoniensis]PTQ85957.1 molybdopterin/thiamine biosynthesis adenylyltransferase [Trichococcus patagoniensis]